ncbi:hypothetical protein BDV06DRAFT_194971 [Aspergillus oleicola]
MSLIQAISLLTICLGAFVNAVNTVNTINVVEVDLVFPRNATYAPTENFPFIFAFQNPEYAELLNAQLWYQVWEFGTFGKGLFWNVRDLRWANWSSSDPYLVYQHHNLTTLTTPGRKLWMKWGVHWQSCDQEALLSPNSSGGMVRNAWTWGRMFTIANSTESPDWEVDLVAATSVNTCPEDKNAADINVTDVVMDVPSSVNWARRDTCVLTVNSASNDTKTHTLDPCAVTITPNVAARISCSIDSQPEDCLKNNDGVDQPTIAVGATGILALLGELESLLIQFGSFFSGFWY